MADDFVIQLIACLQAVDDFTFLVVSHPRDHSHCLVQVGVQVGILSIYLLHAQAF